MELPDDEVPALTHWPTPAGPDIAPEDRASVLVVDDTPAMLRSIAGVIEAMGVETCTAHSGREALRLLLQRDFALILLDVRMPIMDGFETAQLIRSRPRSAQTPIIFVTATDAGDDERLKSYELGGADFIHSPVAPDILRSKVRVFVELHQLNRLLRRQAAAQQVLALEISHKNSQLEEASRLKSDFLANMSHELRTPLNAIIGFSELLRDGLAGPLSEQQRDYVGDIFSAGQHLLALINDILDLSKVEAGRMELELAPMRPSRVLDACLYVVKEKALKHRIALTLDTAGVPGYMLGDERKLKQIVYNLLSNALKFTGDGGVVSLTARKVDRAAIKVNPPPGYAARLVAPPLTEFDLFLSMDVRDNGVGIDEADLTRLFQSFVQLNGSLEGKHQGTGLGLALVRRLVALHGGAIGVTSAPGRGSCFQVWLPWREAPPVPDPGGDEGAPAGADKPGGTAKSVGSGAADGGPDGAAVCGPAAGPLVLVAEDDDASALAMQDILHGAGFRTVRAADGEQCLRLAAQHRPAVISLDILMPRLGGWDTLDRLKADPVLAGIPVVIVSVMADQQRGAMLGAARVLQKPVRRQDFLDALQRLGLPGKGRRKARVLVIDDDPKVHEMLRLYLDARRYQVQGALGGPQGIELVRSFHPNLIVLDLMMPEMSGFSVVQNLRGDAATARIPVLVLTALLLNASERERLYHDVIAIIEKGHFSGPAFLTEVERALAPAASQPTVEK